MRLFQVVQKGGETLQFARKRRATDEMLDAIAGRAGAPEAFGDHCPTTNVLEEYLMRRLSGRQLVEFEEHFLVCESCQDRLASQDLILQHIRGGAALLSQSTAAVWRKPKLAWISGLAAALMLLAGIAWQSIHLPAGPPAVILLQTTRGWEDPPPVPAIAGHPLALQLDLTGLQSFAEYEIEIVDASGRSLFQSRVAPHANRLQADLAQGLRAGACFVRVYAPSRELLREYALIVHA